MWWRLPILFSLFLQHCRQKKKRAALIGILRRFLFLSHRLVYVSKIYYSLYTRFLWCLPISSLGYKSSSICLAESYEEKGSSNDFKFKYFFIPETRRWFREREISIQRSIPEQAYFKYLQFYVNAYLFLILILIFFT